MEGNLQYYLPKTLIISEQKFIKLFLTGYVIFTDLYTF